MELSETPLWFVIYFLSATCIHLSLLCCIPHVYFFNCEFWYDSRSPLSASHFFCRRKKCVFQMGKLELWSQNREIHRHLQWVLLFSWQCDFSMHYFGGENSRVFTPKIQRWVRRPNIATKSGFSQKGSHHLSRHRKENIDVACMHIWFIYCHLHTSKVSFQRQSNTLLN